MSGSQRVIYGTCLISPRYPSWCKRASLRIVLYSTIVTDVHVRFAACHLRNKMFYIFEKAIVAATSDSSRYPSSCKRASLRIVLYSTIVTDVRLAACYLRNMMFYIFEKAIVAATSESSNFLYPFIVTDVHVRLACYLRNMFYIFEIALMAATSESSPFTVCDALVRLVACYPTEYVLYLHIAIMAPTSESSNCYFNRPSLLTFMSGSQRIP
jgi:hypothetical protein